MNRHWHTRGESLPSFGLAYGRKVIAMPRTLRLFAALALMCLLGGCGGHDPNYTPSESDIADAIIDGHMDAGWKSYQSAMEVQSHFQDIGK